MNYLDFRYGTLYAILNLASAVYLLWGFKVRLRPMLKAMMAIQLLGDLFFFNLLFDYPVFNFMKKLSAEDRIFPLLLLMGCVLAMDVGVSLSSRWFRSGSSDSPRKPTSARAAGSSNPAQPAVGAIGDGARLNLNRSVARQLGVILMLLAVVGKFCELYFLDIFNEPSVVYAIMSFQPERSLGFAFLEPMCWSLLPIGLALFVMSTSKKRHWAAFFPMLLLGMLSPWKAAIPHMIVFYGLTVYQFGWVELKRVFTRGGTWAAVAAVLVAFPVKSQFRNTGSALYDWDSMEMEFVTATDARLMGGVFQTYVAVVEALDHGAPFMRGGYNVQALYLWVPRLLWKDKPEVAAEKIYDYVGITNAEEPYGETSFAITVFGSFYLDFGAWGALLASLIFGGSIELMEGSLARMKRGRGGWLGIYCLVFTAIFWHTVFALSESGLPSALTEAMIDASAVTTTMLYFLAMRHWWRPVHVSLRSARLAGSVGGPEMSPGFLLSPRSRREGGKWG